MSLNRKPEDAAGTESDIGAINVATKAAQDLEKEKEKSKSKSRVKFGPEMSDANESGETSNERNASGFAPPSGKNRTKKRQHVAGSGVTPEPKEARYTSAYKDGNKIERTPAQIKATAMAVEDRARREKSGLLAAGRRPRPRGSGLGSGDLGNSSDGGSDNGRVSYGGRGRGRGNGRGNGRNFDGNKSRSLSFNSKTKAGSAANHAAGSAAQNSKNRPQAPVIDTCTDLEGSTDDHDFNPSSSNPPTNAASFLASDKLKELALKTPLKPPSKFIVQNPTFAARLAAQLLVTECTLFIFSGQEECLELTETQFDSIMCNLEDVAIGCDIRKVPAPKLKWSKYSAFGDKGYIGCSSKEDANLVQKAVALFRLDGLAFRAWIKEDMEPRHLVSIDISLHLSRLGAARAMEGFVAANTLNGKALSAWIEKVGGWCPITRAKFDTLKFFANTLMYKELLARRNGDVGRKLYLWVGTSERQVHLSLQPGETEDLTLDKAAKATAMLEEAVKEAALAKAEADRHDAAMDMSPPDSTVEPLLLPCGKVNPNYKPPAIPERKTSN
jgi:hypothetical protein